jgi:hypothetical protein
MRGGRPLSKGVCEFGVLGVLGTVRGVQTRRGGGGDTSVLRDRELGPRCGLRTSRRGGGSLGLVMGASKDDGGLKLVAARSAPLAQGSGDEAAVCG